MRHISDIIVRENILEGWLYEDGTVQFVVHTDRPVRFALRVRIPSWAVNANRVTVNGMENETKAVPNTWMTVTREWQDGDTVTIELPYALSFKSVDAQHPEIVALCYGPLVLCCNERPYWSATVIIRRNGCCRWKAKRIPSVLCPVIAASIPTSAGHSNPTLQYR